MSVEIREQEEKAFDFALDRGSPVVWQAKVANALAEQAELVKAEAEFNRITYAAKNELIRLGNELKNHSEFTKTSETADLDPIWSQYNEWAWLFTDEYEFLRQPEFAWLINILFSKQGLLWG